MQDAHHRGRPAQRIGPPRDRDDGAPNHDALQGTHEFVLGGAQHAQDCYAVFARDPVERWASGWLSRYRRGCRGWAETETFHCRRWTAAERAGFEAFRSPEALALALADPRPAVRAAALAAEQSSLHTRQGFAHYPPHIWHQSCRLIR